MKFSLQGFDENGNGFLDGRETVKWNKIVEQTIADSFQPEIMTAVKQAWTDVQSNDDDYNDEDLNTFSKESMAFKFYFAVK